MINEWSGIDHDKNIPWELILQILFAFTVLILFLLYRQYELRKIVKKEIEKSRKKDNLIFQQNKMASLGQMVGNIAHQWRQPLSELSMSQNLILAKLENGKLNFEDLKYELKDSQSSIDEMSKLIDTFEKLYTKRTVNEEMNFKLKDVVLEIKTIFEDDLRLMEIEYIIDIDDDIVIKCDFDLLKQVFLLLVQNSIYFLNSRDIKNKIIKFVSKKENEEISIYVCDNAKGVDNDILPHIFEYNYSVRKDGSNSTGIGLYIVKLIIEEKLKGEIRVSNNKEGACFMITLAS
ncbi:MAG: HAMP domain-containing sensor histidine kinase [Campylobacterota bacterium]|nr:HAMP domain-containing sensor histidine kinase [Campylobacterota bacterium]